MTDRIASSRARKAPGRATAKPATSNPAPKPATKPATTKPATKPATARQSQSGSKPARRSPARPATTESKEARGRPRSSQVFVELEQLQQAATGNKLSQAADSNAAPDWSPVKLAPPQRNKTVRVVAPEDRRTSDMISQFELAEVLSIRAEDIARTGASFATSTETDPVRIAFDEIKQKRCPLAVMRHLNEDEVEIVPVNDLAPHVNFL